jgi:hypothetical protein
MLEHLTEFVDIIKRALREDGMNQASCREIEPAHQVSMTHQSPALGKNLE